MLTTNPTSTDGIEQQVFDLQDAGNEVNCTSARHLCERSPVAWKWAADLLTVIAPAKLEFVVILDGLRYGHFLFSTIATQVITISYSLKVLISNYSMFLLLARWAMALAALYPHGMIGLAALSNAWSFRLLPIALLP